MKKENWINEVLRAGKDIRPVASNPFLASRVEARLQNDGPSVGKMPVRWVYVSAMAMLALLLMNISIWRTTIQTTRRPEMQQMENEYGWNNHDLFSLTYSK